MNRFDREMDCSLSSIFIIKSKFNFFFIAVAVADAASARFSIKARTCAEVKGGDGLNSPICIRQL